jgi:hypothetical protein
VVYVQSGVVCACEGTMEDSDSLVPAYTIFTAGYQAGVSPPSGSISPHLENG